MATLYPAFLTFLVVIGIIPLQTRLFKAMDLVQPIRKELPADQQKKRGTPLMGGLVFLLGTLAALMVQASLYTVFLVIIFALFAFIGFLDDFTKAHFKSPDGISGRTKLVLQFCFGGAALYYALRQLWITPHLWITTHLVISVPTAVFVIGVLLIVAGSTNAINFTDGLDGLLSFVAIPTYFFFFVISENDAVKLFALVMIACLLGFLFYNRHPAKLIMGDTGSMAIGASLSFLAVLEHAILLMPILFLVYLAEILSVIIQVAYFKRTGRRIFRMSPIHYHFSLKHGWDENIIVLVFGAVSWVCSLLCIGYYELFLR